MFDFAYARQRMIDAQLKRRGIADERVLAAMQAVPREAFVESGYEEFAYDDTALPIAQQQTISQPYIVALMAQAAQIAPGDKVLEIGAGSGYAAAVLSKMARQVYAIERHAPLTEAARQRFDRLGYGNIHLRSGDGSLGWPEAAPFDAILVAAAGPQVPPALKQQLAIGGRLVLPVGTDRTMQSLLRITRRGEDEFHEETLSDVRFVPLIGEQGWRDDGASSSPAPAAKSLSLPQRIAQAAERLPPLDDAGFGAMFDRFGDRRVVLLGEASHGTSEFYRARAAITRRLIERHGFTIVAVEADWPDAAAIDRFVQHRPAGLRTERPFQRFPTWMWRNAEVDQFVRWLRQHNEAREPEQRTGFYGLDMYSLASSIRAVLDYLDKVDPAAARTARERYGCLTPWQSDPATYGRAVLSDSYRKCEADVVHQCQDLLRKRLDYTQHDGQAFLDAAQNARLVASAERYYRIMYYGGAEAWNLRDKHMFGTLKAVLAAQGSNSKAVVWAHNSHIGDARQTEMGSVRDELNLGQLCREEWGAQAALIGMGTDRGSVAAASDWDGDLEVKQVVPGRADSYEGLMHETGIDRFLLDFGSERAKPLLAELNRPRLERFIGVIYRPESELVSHYASASLARQFDAFLWFDRTQAVQALSDEHGRGMPETYPFGL